MTNFAQTHSELANQPIVYWPGKEASPSQFHQQPTCFWKGGGEPVLTYPRSWDEKRRRSGRKPLLSLVQFCFCSTAQCEQAAHAVYLNRYFHRLPCPLVWTVADKQAINPPVTRAGKWPIMEQSTITIEQICPGMISPSLWFKYEKKNIWGLHWLLRKDEHLRSLYFPTTESLEPYQQSR